MVCITAIRMSHQGHLHEHITDVRWQNTADNQTGTCSRAQMVEWLRAGNHAYVTDGRRTVEVGVVDANPPFLRTHADGVWTDNLLALPRY